ncbi:MAG: phosphate signaling complex protein PhoU [Planctomycetota bacterium]
MSMHLMREIERLKKQLLALSATVEENVHRAVTAVEQGDEQLAQRVMDIDAEVDATEIEVEEECLKIIALHQPVAIDLRFVVACLKINNDLERIGDLARRVAKLTLALGQQRRPAIPPELPAMAERAQKKLKDSLDALVNLDADVARRVLPADDEVDELNRRVGSLIEEGLREDGAGIHGLLQLYAIARCFERIADHATNIAEDVIYMLEGQIVRHQLASAPHGAPPS